MRLHQLRRQIPAERRLRSGAAVADGSTSRARARRITTAITVALLGT